MIKRLLALIRKELRHILRDPRTLAIVFAMPIMMVFLYGYALNMDIKHLSIAILDHDKTPESRMVIENFKGSVYFNIKKYLDKEEEVEPLFRSRRIKAAVVIPRGFGEDRVRRPEASVQLLVDGSDPTVGNLMVNYANAVVASAAVEEAAIQETLPFEIRERFLYNPNLESSHFIIPGLVAVILMMICALLTSITISREKETGTMDVLLVSPVHPLEIVVGKVIPYVVLSLMDAVFILVFAKLIFDIPLRGDLILLTGLTILFIFCSLSIGLFISSVAPTQQVAMMAALIATIMPSVIFSGFIFPIFSMPAPIRALTYIVPARHYIQIIRGILLKSSSWDVFMNQALFLAILGTFFLSLAILKFKTRIR